MIRIRQCGHGALVNFKTCPPQNCCQCLEPMKIFGSGSAQLWPTLGYFPLPVRSAKTLCSSTITLRNASPPIYMSMCHLTCIHYLILTVDVCSHERMITRLLSLGNIMVASSEVRRGPYWHALEISLYASAYSRHIEAVLVGVSERLGLTSFSMLFEAYASQIAFSIRRAGRDFLQFPPHLLGFRDRKECAEVMLRAFTPTNLIAGGTPQDIDHGRTLFENHCENIEKSTEDGIRECFGDIVGLQIATWMDVEAEAEVDSEVLTEELDKRLKHVTMFTNRPGDFDDILRQNIDGVVAAILRTFGDQDISPDGAIFFALRPFDNTGSSA